MYDIVFCTLPVISVDQIYSAPALLKGVVKSAGFNARTFDFGIDLYKQCNKDLDQFTRIQNYFITKNSVLDSQDQVILDAWYDYVVETLSNIETRYIGFSVFSNWTHKATVEILLKLRRAGLDQKVVLGGRGLKTNSSDTVIDSLPNRSVNDSIQWFGTVLKNKKLATHIIIGDGENAIVEFLTTNRITKEVYQTKGFDFPCPDYEDYNFDDYIWAGERSLQVKSSQGCVRNCDFCDIKMQFGDYQFKDGLQLAEKMIALQQQYQINKFVLVDSLCNGSIKHFTQFITQLSEYNLTAANKITWTGQYICRDKNYGDDYYRKLKLSGAEGLTIGAESGSNHVLKAMDKKTTVEALFRELEQFKQHNITTFLLTFAGHWSERPEDFRDQCRMLINLVPYAKHGTVSGISLGSNFHLTYDTPAWQNDVLIKHSRYYLQLWSAKTNPGNTLKVRMQRRLVLHKLAKLLNLPVTEEAIWLQHEYDFLIDKIEEINKFFEQHATADGAIEDIDQFIADLFASKTISVKLTVESSSCNSDPVLTVTANNLILCKQHLKQGLHNFEYTIPSQDKNKICLTLSNKQPEDTLVDVSGIIVKDKFIKIKSLIVDGQDLTEDQVFFYKTFGIDGLYFNQQSIELEFSAPFILWFAEHDKKSSEWLDIKNNSQVALSEQEVYSKLHAALQHLTI